MKPTVARLAVLLGCASTGSALAAITIYSSAFEPPTYTVGINDNMAGQDGWVINDPPARPKFADLSFFAKYNSIADPLNNWGALGGRWSTPTVLNPPGVDLTHPAVLPLAQTYFSVQFAISQDQLASPPVTRDNFGWSLKSGASDLFRVAFEPDPLNVNKLEVVWYDSAGARQTIPLANRAIFYDSIYDLQVTMSPSGADVAFSATVIPGVGPALTFGGVLAGEALANVSDIGSDFDATGLPADAGDNSMYFNNLLVQQVPETSGGLALGVCAVGLVLVARKRCA